MIEATEVRTIPKHALSGFWLANFIKESQCPMDIYLQGMIFSPFACTLKQNQRLKNKLMILILHIHWHFIDKNDTLGTDSWLNTRIYLKIWWLETDNNKSFSIKWVLYILCLPIFPNAINPIKTDTKKIKVPFIDVHNVVLNETEPAQKGLWGAGGGKKAIRECSCGGLPGNLSSVYF